MEDLIKIWAKAIPFVWVISTAIMVFAFLVGGIFEGLLVFLLSAFGVFMAIAAVTIFAFMMRDLLDL